MIQVVKPWAHSYIARVYDPLVFVLKDSDRTPSTAESVLLPAVYDFFRHQLRPFVTTVLIVVAAVRVLMNYLLWDETADAKADQDSDDEPLFSVRTVHQVHLLDVFMMSATSDGLVISIANDRSIYALDVRSGLRSHQVATRDGVFEAPFPIAAIAVDDDSNWLAICSSFA